MSERLKSTQQVSNEDVIDDLTKDLKSSLSTENTSEEFVIDPEAIAESIPPPSEGNGTKPGVPADDIEIEKDPGSDKDSDTDSVDEESLKDLEVDLTDDQKAERQLIAEELKSAGNLAFKDGEFERSIEKYTEGLKTCPLQFTQQRSILYCNRSAAKMKLLKYGRAVKDCTKAIELDDKYLKAYLRRAQSYEATEKLDECLADYQKVLQLDPSHKEAQRAVLRLPPLIEEKNEKLKTEMLGKLKDLGNMILKPFGLSTDNFQLEQDGEKHIMAKCRRKRKMRRTRCRSRAGRFKRCRRGDRHYPVRARRRRRSRSRSRRPGRRCGKPRIVKKRAPRPANPLAQPGRPRYLWRCRSRCGNFKRCRHCDRRYKVRRRDLSGSSYSG